MEINNYDTVADLYDIYVPATFDIDFFLTETKKISGEVLELMSGTGRVGPILKVELPPLAGQSLQLACVDAATGATVPASWSLDAPSLGSISQAGVFTPSGAAAGDVGVTCERGGAKATTKLSS